MKSMRNRMLVAVSCGILMGMAACQTSRHLSARDSKIAEMKSLETRVVEFMQYRQAGDMEKMYKMADASFREKVRFEDFIRDPVENVQGFVGFSLEGIEITDPGTAIVYITELSRAALGPQHILIPSRAQRWVKTDDVWYRDLEYNRSAPLTPTSVCGAVTDSGNTDQMSSGVCGS